MSPEAMRQVVASYFAATRAMDVNAWVANFAEDAVSYDPVDAPPHCGHDALRQFFHGIVGLVEKIGLTENQVFIVGQNAAIKWTGEAVGKNGRRVTFEGIDIFEFNAAGKIQTVRAYWNPAAMMAELMS